GYWFIGIAMIAVGMVASFLTSNLTVGFILGTLFNLPLALAGVANWFFKPATAQTVSRWGALEQFRDFERGVISLGGIAYFVGIAAVMLYISMVLIGKRHWQAREENSLLLGHYLVRALSLLAVVVGVTVLLQNRNWLRADVSSEKLSSLSNDTVELIKELRDDDKIPNIRIDAYVSPQVPTEYAATKLNLVSTLEEMKALGGGKIKVDVHEIENFGDEAVLAEKTYGITPQEQIVGGASGQSTEEFFLGVAFTAGLDKVVVPFLNRGIPVEYELVRSILTVANPKRKRLGIVDTGIPFMDPTTASQRDWPLITELRKQYDVSSVDPSQPINETYDVLLTVQPSMLEADQMDHLVDAIKRGTPTAIFEDPFPYFYPPQMVAGTSEPKSAGGGMQMGMFGGPQMQPKDPAVMQQLWKTLGVEIKGTEVVWQDHEPDQSVRFMQTPEWVFIDRSNGATEPFGADDQISSGLNQILLFYAGDITNEAKSEDGFAPLAVTGPDRSGLVSSFVLTRAESERSRPRFSTAHRGTRDSHIVAAHIKRAPGDADVVLEGELSDDADPADQVDEEATAAAADKRIDVVLVSDIDWIIPSFFVLRERGDEDFLEATQNVTFILNIVDALAGDKRFIDIRKRVKEHRTLQKIDEATSNARKEAVDEENEYIQEIQSKMDEAQSTFQEKIEKVENQEGLSRLEKEMLVSQVRIDEQAKLNRAMKKLEQDQERKVKQIRYDTKQKIRKVEDEYKLYAVLVPPILPLLLAVAVYFRRREAERQGVARERLR
ncbi:MAG: Gldg family protein, partial [Planctomycetota bacterium]